MAVTLEATGSLFGDGALSLYDTQQVILDEIFTNAPGELQVSLTIVPETGYYLIVVSSDASYTWAVTVNWSAGGAFPLDNDNDLANATLQSGDSGTTVSSVADWADLVDLYAIDLAVLEPYADALLVNLTSPNIADIDVHIYHIVAGAAFIDGFSIYPFGTEYAAARPPVAGRYYIRVMSYTGSSPYTLNWARLNVTADDNGAPATASTLPLGASSNNLSRWDVRDLFQFFLPANTTVNVSLHTEGFNATSATPDLQAVLWDGDFSRISWSFAFDPDERINAVVPEDGLYYLDIYASDIAYYLYGSLSFNYTMAVSIDRPPALVPPDWNATGVEDTPQAVDLSSIVLYDPPGEAIAFSVVGVTGRVTASIAADGHTLTVVPAFDWSGMSSVTVAASDRWQRVQLTLPVAFVPQNDPPRISSAVQSVSFDEDGAGLLDLSFGLIDPEGNLWTLMDATATAPLMVSVAGGVLTVTVPPNFSGAGSLALVVEDEFGASATLALPVTVRSVNDPPRFPTIPGPFVILEDSAADAARFDIAGAATDADGDGVTYFVIAPAQLSALVAGTNLSMVPSADFVGPLVLTLTASDGTASTSVLVTVRVDPVNDPPHLSPPGGPLVAREAEAFAYEVHVSDIDTPAGDLQFAFAVDGEVAVDFQPGATFERTFSYESAGYHVLKVTVTDGALSSSAEFTIFVSQTNRAPEAAILAPGGATLSSGAFVSFTARTADPDGDSVNVTWVLDGTAVSNSPAFSLERVPAGRHTVELLVFDGELSSTDTAEFEVQGGLPGPGAPLAGLALVGAALVAFASRRRAGPSANAPKKLK